MFFIHSPSSGRNLASCGVDCCACAFKKKSGHKIFAEMRVCALLWYGPYGIQHIETMNKLASNTIFSRSSVLGSTSAPAEKLTFFWTDLARTCWLNSAVCNQKRPPVWRKSLLLGQALFPKGSNDYHPEIQQRYHKIAIFKRRSIFQNHHFIFLVSLSKISAVHPGSKKLIARLFKGLPKGVF